VRRRMMRRILSKHGMDVSRRLWPGPGHFSFHLGARPPRPAAALRGRRGVRRSEAAGRAPAARCTVKL